MFTIGELDHLVYVWKVRVMKQGLFFGIYLKLRDEIVRNLLKPGDKLGEEQLCERFHVSRSPIRQALQALHQVGLVEIRDGVGTFVTTIDENDVRNAYEIRCLFEKYAARNSINQITDEEIRKQEQTFLKIRDRLEKGGYGSSFEDMIRADWELHDLIMKYSGNPMLEETAEKVTLLLRRCQFMYITQYNRATKDHLDIVRSLKERDYEGLCSVLDRHLKYRPLEKDVYNTN